MKNVLKLTTVLVIAFLVTPAAFAGLTPVYDYAPSDPCGSIDPDKACWLSVSTTTCPENKSYSLCIERCNCLYTKNDKACGTNAYCKQLVLAELRACKTNCGIDWASLRALDDAPSSWAGFSQAANRHV